MFSLFHFLREVHALHKELGKRYFTSKFRDVFRTFDVYSGVGKTFHLDGKKLFSTEIHPRSGIQSLYDSDGKQILRFTSIRYQ